MFDSGNGMKWLKIDESKDMRKVFEKNCVQSDYNEI